MNRTELPPGPHMAAVQTVSYMLDPYGTYARRTKEYGDPVLLLAHEPDFADFAAFYPVDLQLSGHSHGGQIVAPIMGAPYLPPMGRKYVRGRFRVRKMQLYTNRGIGVGGAPVRYNAPPEVTLMRLQCAAISC